MMYSFIPCTIYILSSSNYSVSHTDERVFYYYTLIGINTKNIQL